MSEPIRDAHVQPAPAPAGAALQTGAGIWDATHVKALLQIPRYPPELLHQQPWAAWIAAHGGLQSVRHALRQRAPGDPQQQALLNFLLDHPGAPSHSAAATIPVNPTTYRRYTLPRLVRELAQHLNTLSPPADRSLERSSSSPLRLPRLPTPATALIGRERALAAVLELLGKPTLRLLTLAGVGGTGKTRLALQVAAEVASAFRDGVCWVPLAAIRDPALVLPTLAQALGLREGSERPLLETLTSALQDKQLLLLLDNFEQVLAAAPQLTELLQAAPQLKLLVTSRALLHLSGEHIFEVPPLPVPDLADLPGLTQLAQTPAVALFLARIQALQPAFALSLQNAAAVAAICTQLDGLPLAIELAAARCRTLPPQAMLEHLSQRLTLLTRGPRDAPARHQTLRSAIAWSYQLLPPAEQALFARLAIFAGGASLEAIASICPASTASPAGAAASPATALAVLEQLEVLCDQHLLAQQDSDGEARFTMLETLREYALERLEERGERLVLQQHHAGYYLALIQAAEPELIGPQQARWLARLDLEHDNLRAALSWAIEHEQLEFAARLTWVLSVFWQLRGHLSEGRRWMERILQRRERLSALMQARVLQKTAVLILQLGDYAAARRLNEASLALARELGDVPDIARVLNDLGNIATEQGDYAQARLYHEQSLALRRQLGRKPDLAQSLNNIGELARWQGQLEQARAYYEEGLAICRELGHMQGIAILQGNLGSVLCQQGDYARARALFAETMTIERKLGYKWRLAYTLEGMAGLAARTGATTRAVRLLGAAEALRRALGSPLPPVERGYYEHIVALARSQLDEIRFNAAWAEGQAMALDAAIDEALADTGVGA